MAKVLIVPVSAGLDASAAAQAFAKALDAQIFQAVDATAETLLAQGKSDDWFDALVGKVAALDATNLVIEGIAPDADKIYLAGKNVELALSLDAAAVFAVRSDNADADELANRLNLAKQFFAAAPGVLEGFVVDGAAASVAEAAAEKTGLTFFGSSDALKDVSVLAGREAKRLSPAQFRYNLIDFARQADKRIVLPEGAEPRTVQAAAICHEKGIARCVLLAKREEVEAVAKERGISLPDSLEIIDPASLVEQYVEPMCELRKSKGLTPEDARKQLQDTVVLGTMMMSQNDVDGLVSGAVHTTANTILPALQLIKTAPGASLVSSVFFMLLPNQVLVFGDCAVNPNPTAQQLADIAIQSADSAKAFGIDPKVAMISYSTVNSGSGPDVDTVIEATKLAREKRPDLAIDGPLQYDAATVPGVGKSKAPGSPVAGQATVLVFPDLNTGNCTYKAVQRSANVLSVGPLLQGLRKPVNDLSRGALVEDIVFTIALTAVQAKQMEG
ncbi:TPA: phosphate acetyltransferase [Neisseria meningitidis]|uniref:phosphate acetyltransferase n=1 Tax=Neisseria meningitidis TaxID=487 RepID=UPI000766A707|nr:phosphate acetyltransferase [Neisseria meningitidis]CWP21481.1 putative phosphotransacetylase [Neisseria meningitidis]CWQ06262.1 putative phosphotransacetylase [Neisseria meningitidis]CWT08783.1 putative phosphotransacetylase [Neisseria meningitidis]CWT50950.1 putative phosphotransacetylase [Neisseria meningitidis]